MNQFAIQTRCPVLSGIGRICPHLSGHDNGNILSRTVELPEYASDTVNHDPTIKPSCT